MRSLVLLAVPLLAACESATDYPSLAIRDVERDGAIAAPAPPPPLAAPDPAALDRAQTLADSARVEHARFLDALPAVRAAVRRGSGAPLGSKPWGDAQVALATLESRRSVVALPLGDLDALLVEARVSAVDPQPLDAIHDAVVALVAAEDAALAELRALMRR